MLAMTTKEIRGEMIPTIPAGTIFKICTIIWDYHYSTCTGLPVSMVYNDEYVLL